MKKVILSLSLASMIALSFSSCEKIKDKVFPSFDTSGGTFLVNIPVISNTSAETQLGSTTVAFNLDSTIKANTNGLFSISNVNSVKISQITLNVTPNGENNISSFESAKVTIASNANSTPAEIASVTLADVNQPAVINGNGLELKDYLRGNQITYNVVGKARRATTSNLDASINLVLSVK